MKILHFKIQMVVALKLSIFCFVFSKYVCAGLDLAHLIHILFSLKLRLVYAYRPGRPEWEFLVWTFHSTVWDFRNFPATLILREINFS